MGDLLQIMIQVLRLLKMLIKNLYGIRTLYVIYSAILILAELIHTFQEIPAFHERKSIESSGMLVALIQGFVDSKWCYIKKTKCQFTIISRLSSNRSGTRFNTRGINDDGDVSNFVQVLL